LLFIIFFFLGYAHFLYYFCSNSNAQQLCLVNLLLDQQQHFYPRNLTSFEILWVHSNWITSNPILNELRRQLAKLQQADRSLGSDVLTSLCAHPTRICWTGRPKDCNYKFVGISETALISVVSFGFCSFTRTQSTM